MMMWKKQSNPPPPEEKYRPVPRVDPPRPWPAVVNLQPKGETKMGEKIQLGAKVKDSVTGFVGTVTARCEYLYAGARVVVEGIADGKPVEMWIDESRVEVQG